MSDLLANRSKRSAFARGSRAFIAMAASIGVPVATELTNQGFLVNRSQNYKDIRQILGTDAFQLVILDLVLPDGSSATELVRSLRHDRLAASRKAWILLHADALPEGELRAIKNAGVSSLIIGAVSLGTIVDRLKMMLTDKREFVDAPNYVGPDRRVRSAHFPDEVNRRGKNKSEAEVEGEAPAALPAPATA